MTIKTIMYFITALFCFECGITVYRLNRKALANRLYAAGAFLYAVFSFTYVQILVSPDAETSRMWFMFYSPLFFLVATLITHFILELSRYHGLARNRYFLALLYGSGACVAAGVIFFAPVVKGFYKSPWGWNVLYNLSSPWTWVAFGYSSIVLVPGIAALARWRKNASRERTKKQAGIILPAAYSTMALSLAQIVLTMLLLEETTSAAGDAYHQAVYIFFIGAIRFAIWKYKPYFVDASTPATELFSGINDAVFLADRKGDLVFMNDHARDMSRRERPSGGPISLFSLFTENDYFQRSLRNLYSGASQQHPVTLELPAYGGAGIMELFMYPLKNESGLTGGVLVVSRKNPGLGALQQQLGLTVRELEVLLMLGNGQSAGSIAEECGICLQTAKSHIHNIYRKTGLANRVELANLLNKHS